MGSQLAQQQLDLSKQWLEDVVIGLNLCPFAKPVIKAKTIRYALSQATEFDELLTFFCAELASISAADERVIATTIVVLPASLGDFYDYLDFLAACEAKLQERALEGVLQLASFHPLYLFAGVEADDISHYTNRSPYPMIHIIREAQMSRVLDKHPNSDAIPERNIELLKDIGKDGLVKIFPPFANY
jgi:hypothetical protein